MESDFEQLALKHYTSKLRDFTDLETVQSFGFRGEALSSLCSVSTLKVTTKRADSAVGWTLEYDREGALATKRSFARDQGTSVTIEGLFQPMPVRHVELKKNLKREYAKALGLIQSYALVQADVRISVSNSIKSRRLNVFATSGRGEMKDNIVSIYGAKQMSKLDPVEVTMSSDELEDYSSQKPFFSISMKGFTSRGSSNPGVGNGRSSSDRQHYSVNSRPVDMPLVSRTINEVYRSHHNQSGYPVAIIDFTIDTRSYDINITPDKRTIFLHFERDMCALIKVGLLFSYSWPSNCVCLLCLSFSFCFIQCALRFP